MIDTPADPPDNDDGDPSDEATRILMPKQPGAKSREGGASFGKAGEIPAHVSPDEATRILPARHGAAPGKQPGQGAVIGVAGQRQAADDEGRTMFMPGAMGAKAKQDTFDPAVAWLVVVEGPGRGNHCPVYYGQNSIGRGADQRIRLGFGDVRIARDAHAYLIYDDVARKYYLRDNGKANLVRLNGSPVMTPMELKDRDRISIGETVLLFVPLCGENFDWLQSDDNTGSAPGT